MINNINRKEVLGLNIVDCSTQELAVEICNYCQEDYTQFKTVVTCNSDHLTKLNKFWNSTEEEKKSFVLKYKQSDWITADGFPLVLASKLLNNPIQERITGVDLLETILKESNKKKLRIAILGPSLSVLNSFMLTLLNRWPHIEIGYVNEVPLNFKPDSLTAEFFAESISKTNSDLLITAFGFPNQEEFLFKWGNKTKCKIGIGVGASLEFIAGIKPRSPLWMQKLNLEWFARFLNEPKRLGPRYFQNLSVFYLIFTAVLKQKLNKD